MRHAPGGSAGGFDEQKNAAASPGWVDHPLRTGSSAIDLASQFPRTFKGDHLALTQGQVGTGSRISSPSRLLLFNTKLAKSGHEDIVSAFEGSFNDFKQGFDGLNGLFFRKTQVIYLCDDIVFGQCHCASSEKWLPVTWYGSINGNGSRRPIRSLPAVGFVLVFGDNSGDLVHDRIHPVHNFVDLRFKRFVIGFIHLLNALMIGLLRETMENPIFAPTIALR
jgi:hypothetical protein